MALIIVITVLTLKPSGLFGQRRREAGLDMATTTCRQASGRCSAAAAGAGRPWSLLALLPLLGGKTGLISNYRLSCSSDLMIVYAIAVLGLNLLTGFNGQISLGHGAFFAVGAYVAAVLMDQLNWPYWATLPVAAIVCFIVGYLFGLPALRARGPLSRARHLRARLAVPQILKYKGFEGLTGGVQGIVHHQARGAVRPAAHRRPVDVLVVPRRRWC